MHRVKLLLPLLRGRQRDGRGRTDQGQALFETALVVLILVFFLFAIVEFGRAFMVSNVMTNAARIGARLASIAPSTQRDANGLLTGGYVAVIQQAVRDEVSGLDAGFGPGIDVVVTQVDGPPPTVIVNVSGDLPAIFNYLNTTSFDIDRSVTFPDQGRRIN
jgi:hypothetical protein